MIDNAIILDLDDTIFSTKSMGNEIFEPFINDLITRLKASYDNQTISRIIDNLWVSPIDIVINRYNIPKDLILESLQVLDNLTIDLNIVPFADYGFIKCLETPKYLITTGITYLQQSKIISLGIDKDFVEIIINDTIKESKTKKDLFIGLVSKYGLTPERTYVIGDNPDSEIKAGNDLNMITIQILRENIKKGDNATYYINSFAELENIFNWKCT